MVDPGGKPCSGHTRGLVSIKEANGTAQSGSAGASCMKDDGGIRSWVEHCLEEDLRLLQR